MHACCMHPRMRRLDMGNASNQVFFGVLMLALCTAATSDNAVTRTHSTPSDDVSSPPIILWSSSPVAPGDTLLLATSGACVKPCTVNITVVSQSSSPPVSLTLTPASVSDTSVMVTLPKSLPLCAYNVTVGGSLPHVVNAPTVWWFQGDGGNVSTVGGWVRCFGTALALLPAPSTAAEDATLRLRAKARADDIGAAARRGDFAEVARLSTLQLAEAQEAVKKHAATTAPSLFFTDKSSGKLMATVVAENYSAVDALFQLPLNIPPGRYTASYSNGYITREIDSFVSAEVPHLGDVTVVTSASVEFDATLFAVADYGCVGGVGPQGTPTSGHPVNCTAAVRAAIAAAGEHGGGTVFFGPGRWYIDGPLLLPDGVLLKGAGTDISAVFLSEDDMDTAPSALIATAVTPMCRTTGINTKFGSECPMCGGAIEHNCLNTTNPPRFGVEDLTLFVTSYYNAVVDIRRDTVGVRFRRVRIRANALVGQGRRNSKGVPEGINGSGVPWADFALIDNGNPLFHLQGQNFEITDCDLWGTWSSFVSHGPLYRQDAATPGGRYGLIQRNRVYHGGACHMFGGVRQMIFESNQCIGNNPEAGGNNIETYGGGFAHHIYIGSNDIADAFGGDHEVMTYDNPGDGFLGGVHSIDPDGVHVTIMNKTSNRYDGNFPDGSPRPCTGPSFACAEQLGGAMIVISGTGAGQYRRIVNWPAGWNWTEGTFEIDRPLDAPLGADTVIATMPFRGQNIFHRTHYRDSGSFQLYAVSIENLVYGMTMERGGGFFSWGQDWRNPTPGQGQGSGFVNPNLMSAFVGNEVTAGVRFPDQGGPGQVGGIGQGWGDPVGGGSFIVMDTWSALNRLIVFKGNKVDSNGNFMIGESSDILVQGNEVLNTPNTSVSGRMSYYVASNAVGVLLVDNK